MIKTENKVVFESKNKLLKSIYLSNFILTQNYIKNYGCNKKTKR